MNSFYLHHQLHQMVVLMHINQSLRVFKFYCAQDRLMFSCVNNGKSDLPFFVQTSKNVRKSLLGKSDLLVFSRAIKDERYDELTFLKMTNCG